MNQRNKKTWFCRSTLQKSVAFSSHFLVISGQKSEEFYSFYFAIFANLRLWENKALFYKLFKLSLKRLRKWR